MTFQFPTYNKPRINSLAAIGTSGIRNPAVSLDVPLTFLNHQLSQITLPVATVADLVLDSGLYI